MAGYEFTKYVKYSDEGTIIALRGLNVKNGKLDLSDVKYIDKSDLSKLSRSKLHKAKKLQKMVVKNDVIMAVTSENIDDVCK